MPPNRSQAFKLCSDDDDLDHVLFAGKQVESWTSMPAFVLFVFVLRIHESSSPSF
jgi:hypothetical protein